MTPARIIAILVLLATALLVGCGGEDDAFEERSVAYVAGAGEDATGELVAVKGRAYPITDTGFVLAGDKAAVVVTALPTEVAKLDAGEVVAVQGDIRPIGPGLAKLLDQEANDAQGLGLPRDVEAQLRLDQGAPAIANPSITGEGEALPGESGG